MQAEIIIILILIVLLLLILPIFVQIRVYVNVYQNVGVVALSIFGIKILCSQAEFVNGKINILGPKKDKTIDTTSANVRLFNKFAYYLLLKIKITRLAIFCDVGKENDAFLPCILRAGFDTFISIFLGILYTKKGIFETIVDGKLNSQNDKFTLSIYTGAIFNILMIIVAFVQAKNKLKRRIYHA
ncbi:MAG: hypothetical protein IJU58_00460 [Clostridia bacterium]|nr:hypothetical protein [Clostridia bacterium]